MRFLVFREIYSMMLRLYFIVMKLIKIINLVVFVWWRCEEVVGNRMGEGLEGLEYILKIRWINL